MSLADRIFWAAIVFVGIHFIWLGGLEKYLTLYSGTFAAGVAAVWFAVSGHERVKRLRLGGRLGGWLATKFGMPPAEKMLSLADSLMRKLRRGKRGDGK